jgi:NitT/TauT family transport system ATP-binding protein
MVHVAAGENLDLPEMTASLSGRAVAHSFDGLTVFDGFDFEVAGGETVALVGPSGCGKSTLLELIAGLGDPDRGRIEVDGRTAGRLLHCALMPQTDCLLPWYSAIDNAALALTNRGAGRREARAEAAPLFARFGLAGFEQSNPAELSGGMRQRVAFLRTLLSGKDVLLLDEPFASLDAITRAELQEWLKPSLSDRGHTVVLVTHDVEEALYLADRVAVLSGRPGRVLELVDSPAEGTANRAAQVTAPAFTALRERILDLLRSQPAGARPGGTQGQR